MSDISLVADVSSIEQAVQTTKVLDSSWAKMVKSMVAEQRRMDSALNASKDIRDKATAAWGSDDGWAARQKRRLQMMQASSDLERKMARESSLASKEQERAANQAAIASAKQARERDRLSRKFVEGYSAAKQYEKALEDINRAANRSIITTKQQAIEINKLKMEYAQFQAGTAKWSNNFVQGSNRAGKSMNRFGMYAQQVGYQVGDFLVQVQSGQNAMVAFGQQGTQLAGLLPGVAGAIVGIGLALTTAILLGTDATDKFSFEWKKFGKDLVQGIEGPIEKVKSAFGAVASVFKRVANLIVDYINFVINYWRILIAVIGALPDAFRAGLDGAYDRVESFAYKVEALIYKLTGLWQGLMDTISGSPAPNFLGNLPGDVPVLTARENYEELSSIAGGKAKVLEDRAKAAGDAVSVLQTAIEGVEPIDIRDYFGPGTPDDKDKDKGGKRDKTLKEVEKEIQLRNELSYAIGLEGEQLRMVQDVKDDLGDAAKNYTEAEIRAAADRLVAYTREQEALEDLRQKQQDLANSISSSFGDAVTSVLNGTETIAGAFKKMAKNIIDELLEVLVVQRLVGEFDYKSGKGSGLAGILGPVFGGFFADGGDVGPNVPIVVGEKEPELFVPRTAGTIYNQKQLAQMGNGSNGGKQQIELILHAPDGVSIETVRSEVGLEIRRSAPKIVSASVSASQNSLKNGPKGNWGL